MRKAKYCSWRCIQFVVVVYVQLKPCLYLNEAMTCDATQLPMQELVI